MALGAPAGLLCMTIGARQARARSSTELGSYTTGSCSSSPVSTMLTKQINFSEWEADKVGVSQAVSDTTVSLASLQRLLLKAEGCKRVVNVAEYVAYQKLRLLVQPAPLLKPKRQAR